MLSYIMFMLNSNQPIKVADHQKLTNQSTLTGGLIIEIVSNSFNESKKSFDKARNVLIAKERDMGDEKYISTRFRSILHFLFRSAKEQQSC